MMSRCGSPPALKALKPSVVSPPVRYSRGFSPALRHSAAADALSLAAIAGPASAPVASTPAIATASARRTPGMRSAWVYVELDLLGRGSALTRLSFDRGRGGPDRRWTDGSRRSAAVGGADYRHRDLGAQVRATAERALERESAAERIDAIHEAAQPRSGEIGAAGAVSSSTATTSRSVSARAHTTTRPRPRACARARCRRNLDGGGAPSHMTARGSGRRRLEARRWCAVLRMRRAATPPADANDGAASSASTAGCLSCHRIGFEGTSGPAGTRRTWGRAGARPRSAGISSIRRPACRRSRAASRCSAATYARQVGHEAIGSAARLCSAALTPPDPPGRSKPRCVR